MRTSTTTSSQSAIAVRAVRFVLLAGVVCCGLVGVASGESPMSVPAEFVSFVTLPGVMDRIERPVAIHVDRIHQEMLIADPGHNRVIIFDTGGNYRYEFSLGDRAAMPMDVAVDSQGFIYIVGSTREGRRLFRFDFDGTFLNEILLPLLPSGQPMVVHNIDIDDHDRIVILDREELRVSICSAAGELINSFPLVPELTIDERREAVLGAVTVAGDRIYVPFSAFGTVFVYSLAGEQVTSYGYKGNNPGQLNFPVAVAVTDDLVAVLDKHRYNVVCFGREDRRFRGEFGGKGHSPGWFYHPTLLEMGPDNQVYVGQIFENKVQICRIPEFITSNRRPGATETSTQGS